MNSTRRETRLIVSVINTREGIEKAFDAVYRRTGDESFRTDLPNRKLNVNLLASENKAFVPERDGDPATSFPYLFRLTITMTEQSPTDAVPEEPVPTPGEIEISLPDVPPPPPPTDFPPR